MSWFEETYVFEDTRATEEMLDDDEISIFIGNVQRKIIRHQCLRWNLWDEDMKDIGRLKNMRWFYRRTFKPNKFATQKARCL